MDDIEQKRLEKERAKMRDEIAPLIEHLTGSVVLNRVADLAVNTGRQFAYERDRLKHYEDVKKINVREAGELKEVTAIAAGEVQADPVAPPAPELSASTTRASRMLNALSGVLKRA